MSTTKATGRGGLSVHGKEHVARSMFGKGSAFFMSYLLLRQHSKSEPTEYVALHNLCQSVELILKSLLLFKNYDKFRPQLAKKKSFGHDLVKLASVVSDEYSFHKLSRKSAKQLQELSKLYGSHRLRYGTGLDLFIAPATIERARIVRLLAKVIRISIPEQH